MTNPLDFVIALQVVFGLGFLLVGAVVVRSRAHLRHWRGRTTGTIITLRALVHAGEAGEAGESDPAPLVQTAAIRYVTEAGELVTAHAELTGSLATGRPGDRVRVLYDPERPERMQVDTTITRGLLTAVWLLAMGTIFEVVAVATATYVIAATN